MTEKTLWQWASKARLDLGDELHVTRVENVAGEGHPDAEGCYRGVQFWLELKVAKRPARSATLLRFGSPLRDSQVDWARKRIAAGGRVWYLIQVGSGHERQVYLIRATTVSIDALYHHVNEDWLRQYDSLDEVTPAQVMVMAAYS